MVVAACALLISRNAGKKLANACDMMVSEANVLETFAQLDVDRSTSLDRQVNGKPAATAAARLRLAGWLAVASAATVPQLAVLP